jgi:hypothetical protein
MRLLALALTSSLAVAATIEKDAVVLIEFRHGLDREYERVPFFERVNVAVERSNPAVVG